MRLSFVAALGIAAGLIAGPAVAATSTHHHHRHAMRSSKSGAMHMAARHHRTHGRHQNMQNPNAQNGEVEQLNNMSLQAAQKGHSYTPPGGAMSHAPTSGGMNR